MIHSPQLKEKKVALGWLLYSIGKIEDDDENDENDQHDRETKSPVT